MQLSGHYPLDRLRDDGIFIPYRDRPKQTELATVLPLAPTSDRLGPETIKKIEHEGERA